MFRSSYGRIPAGPLWLAVAAALLAIALGLLPDRLTAQSRRAAVRGRNAGSPGVTRSGRRPPSSRQSRVPNSRPPDSLRVAQLEALEAARNLKAQIESLQAGEQPPEDPQQSLAGEVGEQLPDDGGPYEVPLAGSDLEEIILEENDGLISLFVRNGQLQDVLTALAEAHALNIVTADGLNVPLTITLDRVRLEDAIDAILDVAGYTWVLNENNIIFVTSLAAQTNTPPRMQGRRVEVFQLDYATADDVNTVISGMLSGVGQSWPILSDVADNRRSREVLVVEDLPEYLDRIREQIAMIDVPPRQVLIQVYILQVELDDDNRHGINFGHGFNMNSNLIELNTNGLANGSASQAFTINVSGGNLTSLVEMIQSTTDSKTLASPKLLCLNGQTSRIQVGEQLGFRVTTTTETSTTESVEFLDVGVVLEVTPRISRDGRVVMRISPEVSSGEVGANTGLPEEATTELETDVLLGDNQGVVIGGLIQEVDTDIESKVPFLGDLHLVGKLFQRSELRKSRSEIIIALLPHVIPYSPDYQAQADFETMRAQVPLLYGPLVRNERPWEASMPDAIENPKMLRLPPVFGPALCRQCAGYGCNECEASPITYEPQLGSVLSGMRRLMPGRLGPDAEESRPVEPATFIVPPPTASLFRRLPSVKKTVPDTARPASSMLP